MEGEFGSAVMASVEGTGVDCEYLISGVLACNLFVECDASSCLPAVLPGTTSVSVQVKHPAIPTPAVPFVL